MDKSTLSNYGWVVIAVLVLSVMIALATPFGKYIATAAENTTEGLFNVQQKAMGVAGLVVDDQSFKENDASENETPSIAFNQFYALADGTGAFSVCPIGVNEYGLSYYAQYWQTGQSWPIEFCYKIEGATLIVYDSTDDTNVRTIYTISADGRSLTETRADGTIYVYSLDNEFVTE